MTAREPAETLTGAPFSRRDRVRRCHVLHRLFPSASSHVLGEGRSVLGRSTVGGDPRMSSEHAEIVLADGVATVRDLGSKNGTWRAGARISEAALADGDVLRLGDTFLLYRVEPLDLVDAHVPGILGVAPALRALRADVARIAGSKATVLLGGETGTGKSVVAQALHALSGRRGAFVHVNCAAIPESLAESYLFGHVAGAFTDARSGQPGVLQAADGGTLLLDEVGALSRQSQARLLVAVETSRITPLGSTRAVPVDVRIVAASNEELGDPLRFRPDLLARLAELTVRLPALREHREDVLDLLRARLDPGAPPLTPDAVDLLLRWHWPGNVRELEKVAIELGLRGRGLDALGPDLLLARFPGVRDAELVAGPVEPEGPPTGPALEELLRAHGGNVSEVARRVGRSTKQVYRWCARHGLDPAAFRG